MESPVPNVQDLPVNSPQWLEAALKRRCKVASIREHQITHGMDLVKGNDLFLVTATGTGKTLLLLAPIIAADVRGEDGIAIFVVPTKVLVEQQARVALSYGLRAYAIHEDTVREATLARHDLFKEWSGGHGTRVAFMSPQMLRGSRMSSLLNSAAFKALVKWFLVDEVHLLDEESGTFRDPYRWIAVMRNRLLSSTIWACVTGSATPSRVLHIAHALGFRPGRFINARYSTDRPNVKYIPRFFQHSVSGSTFLDLSFIIPFGMQSPQDIATTLIFATSINTCFQIMQFLDSLIPISVPKRDSIIKLYNSLMDPGYRRNFISDITSGEILRVGVVTDTCTYGFDVPNIRRVVVFDLCPSPENLKQKVGRPGRNGAPSEAITFAPAWLQELPDNEIRGKQAIANKARRDKLPLVTRQWYNPTARLCCRKAELLYNGEASTSNPDCCITCNPEPQHSRDSSMVAQWLAILKSTQDEKGGTRTFRSDGTYHTLEPQMKDSLRDLLIRWRGQRWASIRDPKTQRGIPPDVFLPGSVIESIVDRAHIWTTVERFQHGCAGWDHFDRFGIELLQYLQKILQGFNALFKDRVPSQQQKLMTPDDLISEDDRTPPPSIIPSPPKIRICANALTHNQKLINACDSIPSSKRPAPVSTNTRSTRRRTTRSNKENDLMGG